MSALVRSSLLKSNTKGSRYTNPYTLARRSFAINHKLFPDNHDPTDYEQLAADKSLLKGLDHGTFLQALWNTKQYAFLTFWGTFVSAGLCSVLVPVEIMGLDASPLFFDLTSRLGANAFCSLLVVETVEKVLLRPACIETWFGAVEPAYRKVFPLDDEEEESANKASHSHHEGDKHHH
jgi:hypothetical protein